ncbi:MAG: hypothetical protein D6699_02270 [Aquificota bacterium]|nr:MAG: hypothetical protein D6699_02270 [Aquificota bacterium]
MGLMYKRSDFKLYLLMKFKRFLRVQDLELETIRLEQAVKKLREEEGSITEKIQEIKKRKEELLSKRQEILKEIRQKEEQVQECLQKAKKAEERLNFVKKAEEYKALLREKAKNEDCAIKLKKSVEDLKAQLKKLEEELKDKKEDSLIRELEEELEDIQSSLKRTLERLESLKGEKENLLSELDPAYLQEYETLKKKYGLPFMVKVDTMGACGYCGTRLPSALYSRIIRGEVLACPFCGRLLYYEESP